MIERVIQLGVHGTAHAALILQSILKLRRETEPL